LRRPFFAGARRLGLGLLQPLAQADDLALEHVDPVPLLGDGLVQRLDGDVLKRHPRFEHIDAVAESLDLIHRNRCSLCRKPWASATRSSNTKHSPRQRLSVSGTPSRYFRIPPLRW